jgi:transcriptional regulator with XRE-family HTH domain
MSDRLTSQVARLLRMEREKADLSQSRLAVAAGTTQQCVSQIEQGRHAPSLAVLDRLFAALGHQLRVELEVLDSDLDATIDRIGEVTDDKRAEVLSHFDYVLGKLAGVRYVIEGELGAILQDVPLKTSTLSLAVAQADLDAFANWILSIPNCSRWNPRWRTSIRAGTRTRAAQARCGGAAPTGDPAQRAPRAPRAATGPGRGWRRPGPAARPDRRRRPGGHTSDPPGPRTSILTVQLSAIADTIDDRAARPAGRMAATTPASAAIATYPSSCPTGTVMIGAMVVLNIVWVVTAP